MQGGAFLSGRLLRLIPEKFQLPGFGRELFKLFLILVEIGFPWFFFHDLQLCSFIPQGEGFRGCRRSSLLS